MAAPSVLYSVLQATQKAVKGLALTYKGKTIPVSIRKLPHPTETLDPLPQFVICPKGPDKFRRLAFGVLRREYLIQTVMIAAGNRDMLTDLDTYCGWRQKAIAKFAKVQNGAFSSVSQVWSIKAVPDLVIDPALVNGNYDYGAVGVEITTAEPDH